MLLAAGRGERLRPLTDTTPKPLIPVNGKAVIEHCLEALGRQGFRNIVVNLSYLGQQIRAVLGDGRRFGLRIRYSVEQPTALESAGGIRQALPLFQGDKLLVMNADIITDMDFSAIALPAAYDLHLIMVRNPAHHPAGDFALDLHTQPQELLLPDERRPSYTFSGVGCYRLSLFRAVPPGTAKLAPLIRQAIAARKASAGLHTGKWFDIGTVERLRQAEKCLREG